MNHTARQRKFTSTRKRKVEVGRQGKARCHMVTCEIKRWGGHLRRVPWLVRPRREWVEEGVRGFKELAEASSSMCVGECDVHGEVAVNKEAHARDSVLAAHEEDMFCVVKPSAVWACGVIRGSGSVTKGIISLEGVPCDDLECGTLKSARVGLEHALDEWVEVIRVGWLCEG
jgi:hypothetical protein